MRIHGVAAPVLVIHPPDFSEHCFKKGLLQWQRAEGPPTLTTQPREARGGAEQPPALLGKKESPLFVCSP